MKDSSGGSIRDIALLQALRVALLVTLGYIHADEFFQSGQVETDSQLTADCWCFDVCGNDTHCVVRYV